GVLERPERPLHPGRVVLVLDPGPVTERVHGEQPGPVTSARLDGRGYDGLPAVPAGFVPVQDPYPLGRAWNKEAGGGEVLRLERAPRLLSEVHRASLHRRLAEEVEAPHDGAEGVAEQRRLAAALRRSGELHEAAAREEPAGDPFRG